MAESFINLTEGSGKKAHTFQRTIGANSVEDEVILNGEQYLATYEAVPGAVSTATAASHLLQIMAGASLNVYIRRVRVYQIVAATAAAIDELQLLRLTTAGTGGGVPGISAYDSTDAAAGATAMTLPTVKGTEGTVLARAAVQFTQTIATQSPGREGALLLEWDFDRLRTKCPRIAAGTTNGIAVKNITARAGASVLVSIVLSEANF